MFRTLGILILGLSLVSCGSSDDKSYYYDGYEDYGYEPYTIEAESKLDPKSLMLEGRVVCKEEGGCHERAVSLVGIASFAKPAYEGGSYSYSVGYCSGFLLDEKTVLTNEHCVDFIEDGDDCSEKLIATNPDKSSYCKKITRVANPKTLNTSDEKTATDLAIIHLHKPIRSKSKLKRLSILQMPDDTLSANRDIAIHYTNPPVGVDGDRRMYTGVCRHIPGSFMSRVSGLNSNLLMPIYGENAKNCDVRRGNSGSGVTAVGGSEDGQLVAALSMEINYRDSEGEKTFPDFFTPKLMPDYHAQYEEMRGSSEKQTRWHGLSVQLGCFEIESAESSNGTNWKIIYREQVQSCSYESIDLERVMDLEMVSNELVKSIGLSDTTKEGEEEVFKEASDLSQGVFRFESDGDRSPINLSGPRGPMNFYSYIPSCYDKDKIEELAESAIDSEAETFSIPLVLPGSVGEIYIDQSLKDFRYRHQSWSTKEVKVFDVYIEDKELSDLVTKAEEDINSETGLEACE